MYKEDTMSRSSALDKIHSEGPLARLSGLAGTPGQRLLFTPLGFRERAGSCRLVLSSALLWLQGENEFHVVGLVEIPYTLQATMK